ncbi:OmpP1/FadL family transporter [Bacteroidota bacterium]
MKKYIFIIIALTGMFITVNAQNEVDALRYSQTFQNATARSLSVGGAFGALGADLSVMGTNPAGIGIYKRAELSFTPGFYYNATESDFLNTKNTDSNNKMHFQSYGIVFPVFTQNNNSNLKNLNFGFSYNRIRDFNSNVYMEGINNNSSMVNEFVYTANTYSEFDIFSDGLAWETYLMDYDSIGGFYYGDFEEGSPFGQMQKKSISTRGSIGEYTFSIGGKFNDYVYFGASFSLQSLRYFEDSKFSEDDINNQIDYFNWFDYKYSQETTGNGYNFKLGAIVRPVDWLRVGAAIHSPTFFKFKDYWIYSMETSIEDGESPHFYDAQGENDSYQELTTPLKAIGSLAVIVKKAGIISIDYEYVDYSTSRLGSRSNDYFYTDENQAIKDMYKSTANIRIGGELRLGNISLRGGYGIFGSPYKSTEVNSDAFYKTLSAGIGFRSNNFFLDLVIVNRQIEESYFLYYENEATLNSSSNRILATFGFRF